MPCDLCHTEEENDESHRDSAVHRFNYMLQQYQKNKRQCTDSNGVELQIDVKKLNGFSYDFTREPNNKGTHYLNMTPKTLKQHGNQVEFECRIKNARTRKRDPIVVTYAGVLYPYMLYSMTDPGGHTDQENFFVVEAGRTNTYTVKLKLEENNVSNYKIPILFTVQTLNKNLDKKDKGEQFSFARSIVVAIHDLVIKEHQIEKSPFTNNPWGIIENLMPPVKVEKLKPGYVTLNNYVEFWHVLLWLEEMCTEIGLSCYNMENVNLAYVDGGCLKLEVPGLAEKRPSVIKGDRIEIKVHGDHTAYQGVIFKVEDKYCVITGLHPDIVTNIQQCPKLEMDVRFRLGRIHYERMHRGVEQVEINGFLRQLFPSDAPRKNIRQPITIGRNELFNKQIYTNQEQMTAVEKIVNNTSKGAPYIVYGPPGTGML
ncbi:unnamed protein product [Ceutorhynchus assimilis]|uniref:Helicase MOV-10-like beta-barrel domain-containing protein n=1 Tax=Ceutorhynchus assimilis TaxID=467358 RepID=A0A9N9MNH6_9CUCU|nr:unnamed protein product [Ceutorhynchus assimilis]